MNTKSRLILILFAIAIFMSSSVYAQSRQIDDAHRNTPIATVESKQTKPEPKNDANNAPVAVETPEPEPTPISTPEPAVVAQNTPNTGGCEQWRPLIEQYGWDVRIAMAVMQQESTQNGIPCNPNAANTTDVHRDANGNVICIGSYGLMQISCHSGQVYDPAQNIAIAWQKYQARGWQPWGAYTSGEYAKYLR